MARRAALVELLMPTVATGIPLWFCNVRRVRGVGIGGEERTYGHLNDAQQTVLAVEVCGLDWYSDDGYCRLRGEHAGQMRRSARGSDDGLDASRRRRVGQLGHARGRAVRRGDGAVVRHLELLEDVQTSSQHAQVRVGAHGDDDQGRLGVF